MDIKEDSPRQRLTDIANTKSIMEVAQSFGMTLEKTGKTYKGEWQGHDTFSLNPTINKFRWYGKGFTRWTGVIDLVSVLKYGATTQEELNENFRKSVVDLNQMDLKTFDAATIPKPKVFQYFFEETPDMELAKRYLKGRGLSDATINFFEKAGVLAQGNWRTEQKDGRFDFEPVVLFKNLDTKQHVIGGSAQGIEAHPDWEGHQHKSGHLKRVLPNSGNNSGIKITIGTPKRVIIAEAPIDLMSYYELHQTELQDVILIASDGYKPEAILRCLAEIMALSPLISEEWKDWNTESLIKMQLEQPQQLRQNFQNFLALSEPNVGEIIFAYDNDAAGYKFVNRFKEEFSDMVSKVKLDFPPLVEGQEKSDWNDELKYQKNILVRPRPQSEIEKVEAIVSRYSSQIPSATSLPLVEMTQAQSRFIKQKIQRIDEKGKPYTLSKIYELPVLTDFSQLEADQSGRVSLDVIGVLTIEKRQATYQVAKFSVDKTLKNSRFVLSFNIAKESLTAATFEEIRALRQAKNGETVNLSAEKLSPPKSKATKQAPETLDKILEKRQPAAIHEFLSAQLKDYQSSQKFKTFLSALTYMPEQTEENIRLLLAQNPNVQQVADFNTWSEIKNSRIKPKSQALKLFVPNPIPRYDKQHRIILDKRGNPEIARVDESLASVFDISQTIGAVFPETIKTTFPREKGLELFQNLSKMSEVSIHFSEKGLEKDDKLFHFEHAWFNQSGQELVIQKGLPVEQALQTLCQEIIAQRFSDDFPSPELKKLAVESIRYVTLRRFGLETTFEPTAHLDQLSLSQLQNLMKSIQENIVQFTTDLTKQLKPVPKKVVEKMTLKEKLAAAQVKEKELLAQQKEVEGSKKVQGAPHQAPVI